LKRITLQQLLRREFIMKNRTKATLLLGLSLIMLVIVQSAAAHGNLCIAAEFGCEDETGRIVLALTGAVTGLGVEAAGILLCVNPWLGLGMGAAFVG
jgi:hypothetical protein